MDETGAGGQRVRLDTQVWGCVAVLTHFVICEEAECKVNRVARRLIPPPAIMSIAATQAHIPGTPHVKHSQPTPDLH
jgi:hypothetical protein